MIEPNSRHLEMFCGCVEKRAFLPALIYVYQTLTVNVDEDGIVKHEELSKLMNGSMAAYLLLTILENTDTLEHGSSIRNCWAKGEWKDGVYTKDQEYIKALILECQDFDCPWCAGNLDVDYDESSIPHYYCQNCKQTVKESGKK
jgi:hypothetical protein